MLSGDDWPVWVRDRLHAARRSVRLSVYMFSHHWRRPHRLRTNLLDEFAGCAERGLDCRAVFAGLSPTVTRETPNIGAADRLTRAGWRCRVIVPGKVLHEKMLIIDTEHVSIGSHNISRAAIERNHDTSIAVHCPEFAQAARSIWWSRWHEGIEFESIREELEQHGRWKSARTAGVTGRDLLLGRERRKAQRR